ncbi:MAG: SGNH/GDSL hydrolase family protein [Bacteroidota bacterium]
MHLIKYFLGILLFIPSIPFLLIAGKRTRAKVPKLEAPTDTKGVSGTAKKQLNLLVLGESTMDGIGVESHKDGFTGALADLLAEGQQATVNWEVIAKSGYTAKEVLEHLIPTVPDALQDLVLIGLGGNDAFGLNTPLRWKRHMRILITTLQQKYPSSPIICLHMPPIREFPAFPPILQYFIGGLVDIHGKALAGLVNGMENVYYPDDPIRFEKWKQKFPDLAHLPGDVFFSDGVHPSALTYQTWAKDIYRFMLGKNILSQQ